MKPLIYIKSNRNNYYLYNILENSISLCHPYLLEYLSFRNKPFKKKDPIFQNADIALFYKNKAPAPPRL